MSGRRRLCGVAVRCVAFTAVKTHRKFIALKEFCEKGKK
jgi:hypothetical protein